jgi:hypothetical protein
MAIGIGIGKRKNLRWQSPELACLWQAPERSAIEASFSFY